MPAVNEENKQGEGDGASRFGADPDAWFQGADHFTRMWTDFATKMAAAGMAHQPGQQPPEAARQMRDSLLNVWREQIDRYMRSDQFKAMMARSLAGMVDSRKQINELLGRIRHELQGVSRHDVDEVMESIRHLDRRIADSVERLGERMDDIDARLAAMEDGGRAARTEARRGES